MLRAHLTLTAAPCAGGAGAPLLRRGGGQLKRFAAGGRPAAQPALPGRLRRVHGPGIAAPLASLQRQAPQPPAGTRSSGQMTWKGHNISYTRFAGGPARGRSDASKQQSTDPVIVVVHGFGAPHPHTPHPSAAPGRRPHR